MRARVDLLICSAISLGVAPAGCARENPAFDHPVETEGQQETLADGSEDSHDDELADESSEEEGLLLCDLQGGKDMTIKVPQPCGETIDDPSVYEHWHEVVEAAGSTWNAKYCTEGCVTCEEPVLAELTFAPLPVAELAGPGTCMKMEGRRLGSGDDCNYHAVSVVEPSAAGRVILLARRTEQLEIPGLTSSTGLLGFDPELKFAESCDCAETPDSCCGSMAPTLYAYDVGGTIVEVGETETVSINQRPYRFWAFDAFHPGDCNSSTRIAWALTTNQ